MQRGFTLIEVLIALFIFAILGLLITQALDLVLRAQSELTEKEAQLKTLQKTLMLLNDDFFGVIDRPIRGNNGQMQVPFWVTERLVEFTRTGYPNPAGYFRRSSLMRVRYQWQEGQLIRLMWPVLDRVADSQPEKTVVLTNVDEIKVTVLSRLQITASNRTPAWLAQWPIYTDFNQHIPLGLRFKICLKQQGCIERIFAFQASTWPDAYS